MSSRVIADTASSESGRIITIRSVESGHLLAEGYLFKGESDDDATIRMAGRIESVEIGFGLDPGNPSVTGTSGWISDPHGIDPKSGREWIRFKLGLLECGGVSTPVSIGISMPISGD